MLFGLAAGRRIAREACALRAWAHSILFEGVHREPPAASAESWDLFLQQERCSVLLKNATSVTGIVLPGQAEAILDNYVSAEMRRILSVRAHARMLDTIAAETGWIIIPIKGTADIVDGFDIPCMDVDVLVSPELVDSLCSRLDELGFSATDHHDPFHASPRRMNGMLDVEVHGRVLGFPSENAQPTLRSTSPSTFPHLRLASPEDHAWMVLCQAVWKHPERSTRLRDLLILKRAVEACSPRQRASLSDRIAKTATGTEFEKVLRNAVGGWRISPDALSHYLLLVRTARSRRRESAVTRRVLRAGSGSDLGAEFRRLREQAAQQGTTRLEYLAPRVVAAALFRAVAIAITADLRLIHLARGIAAATLSGLYVRKGKWRDLLVPPATSSSAAPDQPAPWVAERLVNRLGRLPASPWKSTCLFRCVAVSILFRWSGIPAVLRIGVRSEGEDDKTLAHAWIEAPDGRLLHEERRGYSALAGVPRGEG